MIEPGSYVWDNKNGHIGVVDHVHEDGLVHYRVHEVGHQRPHGFWTIDTEVTKLAGPVAPDNSTITDRMMWDVLESNPTFDVDAVSGDILWADRDGTTYKVEMRLPGLSASERLWTGRMDENAQP